MDLRLLHEERLRRQQAKQPKQPKLLSDDEFIDLLFNERNNERNRLFQESMNEYFSSRYSATEDDYYKVMNQYSQDMSLTLESKVVQLLGPELSLVLNNIESIDCSLYGGIDTSYLEQIYQESLEVINRARNRTEKFLTSRNNECLIILAELLKRFNEAIDNVETLNLLEMNIRSQLSTALRNDVFNLNKSFDHFFDLCWDNGLIPGDTNFKAKNQSVKNRDFEANLFFDTVRKENKRLIEEVTGYETCDSDLCRCLYDQITSQIVLKLGLKDKFLRKELNFGYIYYEFLAIWNLVYANVNKVNIYDYSDLEQQILNNQRNIRNQYFADIENFINESIKRFELINFSSEDFELKLLFRDIFKLIKTKMNLSFEIEFETIQDIEADKLLAETMQQQNF